MYNTPWSRGSTSRVVSGSLMGQTLGYLAGFLAVFSVATLVGVGLGTAGLWVGIVAVFGGTLLVNRAVARGGNALPWGIAVSAGMGILVGPVIWVSALTDPHLVVSALVSLVLAVALAAFAVAWIPWDFSRLAPLLMVGLLLLVMAGMLSWLIPHLTGWTLSPAYNLLGVGIFTGYLLVDFSLLKYRGLVYTGNGAAVLMATAILVDVVNLFLFLLMLGRRR
ncbi:MAG: Bax inhibitor-1 family protein [Firmicutes bacterium]|nr:US12 family protein [Alicyclobacillaceae bacterium]MCL6496335.1 Bax inhibitor-1 family protein [Bacillota bacterium]